MKRYARVRRNLGTQLVVNAARMNRRLRKLKDEDILSLYEEGSNMYFSGGTLPERAQGASLVSAAVQVLGERYEQVKALDLSRPFRLRDWMNGVPVRDP